MARANRHHIPGQVWHITHRCHKQEFLLRFAKDRAQWIRWLFEAKKRYHLTILNYIATSNHIHLLAVDDDSNPIPRSIQLAAGRTAQAFNRRKKRRGAFWEDRYHATAIESGAHLIRCLTYIDLNMVRAGVVSHPSEWPHSGFHEIQSPPSRYRLIDQERLIALTGAADDADLRRAHREWIAQAIERGAMARRPEFTSALAVGSARFVAQIQKQLGVRAHGRNITRTDDDAYTLREPEGTYSVDFDPKNGLLSAENSVFLDINGEDSVG
ncbi:MAG: transposase [Zetaproteobacteria bacterium]|nr:MAG: transposase [Zetaproteobacteria bacterium]